MLPFIVLGLLVVGSVAVISLSDFNGKAIAIIGSRSVGKTTLFTFLSTGSIPSENKQTTYSEKLDPIKYKLDDKVELNLKKCVDVSGAKSAYGEWKELVLEADYIFYLFRVDKIRNNDSIAIDRIQDDMSQLNDWLSDKKEKPQIFLIGTHCDHDSNYAPENKAQIGNYFDDIHKLDAIVKMFQYIGGTSNAKLILGTMHTDKGVKDILVQILKQVKS